ncbi:MAG TPA: phosphodiester glycosidase family protein [Capillimicrobium sp.]|nr:phosphodiester glycosidase family protein [Capillimicrobium sp.]
MRRIAVTAAVLVAACALPAAAPAARHGIEVKRERVTFGPHASTVTVVTMPRPGGNRVLAPAIPGGVVSEGTATVSAVSKQLSRHGTAVAINADLFAYATGQPSGLLIVDGEVYNQPQGERPSLQIDTNGTLHTSTPRARGSLVLRGGHTLPFQVNVTTPDDGVVFYDRGWGPSAPSGAQHAIVGRLTSGRIDARGQTWRVAGEMRVVRTRAGRLPIPPDASPDELFQGAGGAAAQLGRLHRGQDVGVRYELGPLARNLQAAIGGGPVLIRDGKIVFSVRAASKAFTSGQLRPPDARTAVAQLRDGRILFYAADRGDGSTGLTIEEVARDLHRRGAVTAMAFDSGGSTSVALNGRLLNQPADGVERPVGNQLVYFVGDRGHGQPVARVTVGSRQPGARVPTLAYTTVRPARIGVSLRDPRGRLWTLPARRVPAGVHQVRIPDDVAVSSGRWRIVVTAVGMGAAVAETFRVTSAPAAPVRTPTNTPAGGSEPDAPTPAAAADASDSDGAPAWVVVAVGVAVALAAAATVVLARRTRRVRR